MSVQTESRPRPKGHDTHSRADEALESCPLCGSALTGARFREVKARMEREEKARLTALETSLKSEFAEQRRRAAAKAATDAAAQVEKARKEAAKTAAAALGPKIAEAVAQAVQAQRTKAYGEKLALEQQLEEMKRRLQRRSAHDIGEPAEVDLHAALVAAFPEDRISRVAKGVRGPDVIVEVLYEGNIAGKIVFDSKDHLRWSNKFTSKLRADQSAEEADFAILSSSTFPAGTRELHIQDNVIIASPARVIVLVNLLRRQIIENFRLKLTAESRNEKGAKLLAFIASASCADLFEQVAKLTSDLLDIERSDAAWQEKTRNKRTGLIHGVQTARDELVGAINRILASAEAVS